jgi:hypothetical protein
LLLRRAVGSYLAANAAEWSHLREPATEISDGPFKLVDEQTIYRSIESFVSGLKEPKRYATVAEVAAVAKLQQLREHGIELWILSKSTRLWHLFGTDKEQCVRQDQLRGVLDYEARQKRSLQLLYDDVLEHYEAIRPSNRSELPRTSRPMRTTRKRLLRPGGSTEEATARFPARKRPRLERQ